MPGPYDGLRVIEFGRFIAAPYAAQLLADGGAEVIKVEPLLGDNTRQAQPVIPGEGRQYLNKNRGKRSLAVDLSNPEILEAVRSLVGGVDVVIANFRPGIAERLDLDYASVSGDNPRVIYAENTAFGPRGPLAGAPGMDIAIQAYSGFAPLDERGPSPLPFPAIDYAAALLIAWGIATSLYHRERTGRGAEARRLAAPSIAGAAEQSDEPHRRGRRVAPQSTWTTCRPRSPKGRAGRTCSSTARS